MSSRFKKLRRFLGLVWRDPYASSAILFFVAADILVVTAIIGYLAGSVLSVAINAAMAGFCLASALFQSVAIFHKQARRDEFEGWANGKLHKLQGEMMMDIAAGQRHGQGEPDVGKKLH